MINIPWYTYLTYGDKGILERNIEQMIAYHKYIHENTTDLIHNDHKYPLPTGRLLMVTTQKSISSKHQQPSSIWQL